MWVEEATSEPVDSASVRASVPVSVDGHDSSTEVPLHRASIVQFESGAALLQTRYLLSEGQVQTLVRDLEPNTPERRGRPSRLLAGSSLVTAALAAGALAVSANAADEFRSTPRPPANDDPALAELYNANKRWAVGGYSAAGASTLLLASAVVVARW